MQTLNIEAKNKQSGMVSFVIFFQEFINLNFVICKKLAHMGIFHTNKFNCYSLVLS